MKNVMLIAFCLFIGTLQAQVWQETLEDAIQKADEENKPIVLVFSGSDWCAPCIRLKRSILESDYFKKYAFANYILYNADFPRKKKNQLPLDKLNTNKSLAEKYNPRGYFPLVVVMDKQQVVLGKTGFSKKNSPEDYVSALNGFLQ